MGWFSEKKNPLAPKIEFIKKGNKIKVVETTFERDGRGRIVDRTSSHEYRPTDKKLEKMAEKVFKEKGDVYFSGTIQKKGDMKHLRAGISELFKPPPVKGKLPKHETMHPKAYKDHLKRNPKEQISFVPDKNRMSKEEYTFYLEHERRRQGL
jgi:hypothetical protein